MTKGKSRNKIRIDPRAIEDFDDDPQADYEDPKTRGPKTLARKGEAEGTTVSGMVVGIWAKGCEVVVEGELLDCVFSPAVKLDDENDLAVGDRVNVRREPGRNVVTSIEERSTLLSRPDPLHKHRERVIATNIDLVVHVASVIEPPLRAGLVDRFLIAIQRGGAAPLVVVNKIDLAPSDLREDLLSPLEPCRAIGIPILLLSTKTGEGLEELRQRLLGRTSVFAGHSGVGKSSIIRALKPEVTIRVGGISAKRGTGRHTTTRVTLYELGSETRVIDTPGIREFGLWQVDPGELRFYFPEFEPLAVKCRFNDCLHIEEPDCAIKPEVERETISPERYASYVKIVEELRGESE
ncbi:MAG: ribosome small subunit-dependent GTPase A [Thermoanaerobaculia bacterium]